MLGIDDASDRAIAGRVGYRQNIPLFASVAFILLKLALDLALLQLLPTAQSFVAFCFSHAPLNDSRCPGAASHLHQRSSPSLPPPHLHFFIRKSQGIDHPCMNSDSQFPVLSARQGDNNDVSRSLHSAMDRQSDWPSPPPPQPSTDNRSLISDSLAWRRPQRRRLVQLKPPSRVLRPTHAIFGALMRDSAMTDAILKYDVYQIMQSPDDDDGDGDHECDGENDEYDGCIVVAKIQLGRSADGHPGVVHGGILALLIDDVLGFAYPIVLARNCSSNKNDSGSNSMVSASNTGDDGAGAGAGADVSTAPPDDTGPANDVVAVTANLNVNYASPVPSGSSIRVLVYLTEQTARKLVWKAIVRNKDGNDDEGGGGSDPERKSPSSLLYPPSSSSSFITYCEATSVYVIPRTSCTL